MSEVDTFKLEVRKFNNIDEEISKINKTIKPYQEKLKQLKQSKKELEGKICTFMLTNEIDQCKMEEGALVYEGKKAVVPLSKNAIKENILKFFKNESRKDSFKNGNDEEKSELLFNFIYDSENREYNDKSVLKRVE